MLKYQSEAIKWQREWEKYVKYFRTHYTFCNKCGWSIYPEPPIGVKHVHDFSPDR